MLIQYRIIKKDPENRQIVVRFFTDIVTEMYLAAMIDPVTLQPMNIGEDGNPVNCRTDVAIELPIQVLTPEELNTLIMRYCRWDWFEKEERKITAAAVPDPEFASVAAAIASLPTAPVALEFAGTPKTDQEIKDAVWETIKIKRDNMITSGGFKVVHMVNGVNTDLWFHTTLISTTQQLGLILGGFMAKMQGAPGTTLLSPSPWSTMSNVEVPLTIDLALKLLPASMQQQGLIFAAAKAHKTALYASTTPKDYDYKVGWPVTFPDTLIQPPT